ncbi:MAG: hypothetical protein N2Z72_07500 [Bacteroidales bacterium]|nr:hypothetical protein [Bacteroidales bacterium]
MSNDQQISVDDVRIDCKALNVRIIDSSLKSSQTFLIVPPLDSFSLALDSFFYALEHDTDQVIRIGHWGDSQIEGDRLTNSIRKKMQNLFKGKGLGFVPVVDVTNPVSFSRVASDNWMRYTFFQHRLKTSSYGPGGVSFKPMSYTVILDSASFFKDTVSAREKLSKTYTNAYVQINIPQPYDKGTLWYGQASSPCTVHGYAGGKSFQVILQGKEDFNELVLPISPSTTFIKLIFPLNTPLIYGLSFESNKGVIIDNFGVRGHSGDGWLLLSKSIMNKYVKRKQVRLLILQYGANVVPYLRKKEDIVVMGKMYEKIFSHIRSFFPTLPVIFFGPGNMPPRHGLMSHPYLNQFNEELKKLALKYHFAYFDTYQLMGGENSLKPWIEKGLLSKDGHFTDKGREEIAKAFTDAIMHEYHNYLLRLLHHEK